MLSRFLSSRRRFRQYKLDLKRSRATDAPDAAHGSPHAHARSRNTDSDVGDHKPPRRQRSFLVLLRAFWRLVDGDQHRVMFALGSVTIATTLSLIPPYSTKLVVDHVLGGRPLEGWERMIPLPTNPHQQIAVIAVAVVGLTLISLIIGMTGRWQATKTNLMLKPRLRRQLFEHALRLPLHRIYQIKTGGTASLIREDTGNIGELVFSMLYNPWRAIIQLFGSLVILAIVDWRLLLGSLLFLPTVYFTHRLWIRRIRPLYRDMHATRQTIDGHTTETFGGIRVVRSFGRQRSESARFIRNDQFRARQEAHVWWWARGVDLAWAILIPSASAALLWYGGLRVLDGALTVGDLFLFLTYLMMLLDPVAVLAQSATGFQTSLAGLDRVLDLLEEPSEMPNRVGAAELLPAQVAGRITFSNVDFAYPNTDRNVLSGISLDVHGGEMVALVGRSGAGKTTLCNLVARFYDPSQGEIRLDGRDLRDIDLQSYRRLLGIVEQDIFLFDGTVADNIGYGRRDATIDQIIHFSKLANAHEFISQFERGYDSIIGERGVKLSGGQRQRLAIARALLADPRILILDEATSNLDTENERLIQQSLLTLMQGRTSFVIAHRLSTIMHADRIVVLEDGKIIEQGTHDELMSRSGHYRHMVHVQTEPPRLTSRNGQSGNGSAVSAAAVPTGSQTLPS